MDAEKRVPIKLRPVARKHAGKITEPYRITERQREKVGWRILRIDGNLNLPAGTLKALNRKGIATLGELTDTMNRSTQWWVDVPGVGTAAAEKVSDAFTGFWASNAEYAEAG